MKHLGVTGVIGRLFATEIIEAIFALNLPAIGMDLSDEQLADSHFAGRVSEIRPDPHKAGRMAADHLWERGFRRFAFCGHLNNPNWSRQRAEGFCGEDYLGKVFRRVTSTTLAKYRREHRAP
jgi:DNA-binding LacI/PurR family transcriptional regulator